MTEQEKREKVITRLQILRTWCAVNPDYNMGLPVDDCVKAVGWLDEALALLRHEVSVQEPRAMTLEEIEFVYGYPYIIEINESGTDSWFEYGLYSHQGLKGNIDFFNTTGRKHLMADDYGKTWRCWTSRPTDDERRETPWTE